MSATRAPLPLHLGLALLIVAIWGTNFVVIKVGLRDLPPFLFALLRFVFCALPFVFFIPRPKVAWRWLALYGTLLGAGQFGLLFYAMRADISPGMASLVVQTQVFFTIGLSIWLFRERISSAAIAGTVLGAAGLGVVALYLDASVTAKGVMTVVGAAFCWACANVTVKQATRESGKGVSILAFIVWSSVFAVPPLAVLVLVFEGPELAWRAITAAGGDAWLAVAWQVVGNTLFGFAGWNWLLTRYDAAVIAPYALLIPIFGMGSSALLLGESLPPWKWVSAAMVLAGIALIAMVRRPAR